MDMNQYGKFAKKTKEIFPYERGIALLHQRNWCEAILEFAKCKPTPDEPNLAARMHIARCLIHLGKKGGALLIMDELEKEGASMGQLYFERGRLKTHLGDTNGAIADFTTTIGLKYNVKNAHYFRGRAYRYNGEYEEALMDFQKAENMGYFYPKLYYEWARVFFELGQFAEALQKVERALEAGFDVGFAYYMRGVCMAKTDALSNKKSVQDFDKALELGYRKPCLFLNRGISKYKLRDFRAAKEDFEAVIENDPADKNAIFYLGGCLVHLEEYDDAIRVLKKIGADMEHNGTYNYLLAKANLGLGRHDSALMHGKKAKACRFHGYKKLQTLLEKAEAGSHSSRHIHNR